MRGPRLEPKLEATMDLTEQMDFMERVCTKSGLTERGMDDLKVSRRHDELIEGQMVRSRAFLQKNETQ